uniref:Solute carrier family 46 member 3 n=1 Tax=Timema shepardi TaxID=629360 RepID=A0A7R9AS21_TIMSH|nr:unnamed protein product [Timema shepardi]
MNLKEKCKHITANITIEPILAAYILPNTLAALATQNLYLEKACRLNLNYSDKVCTEIIHGNGSIYPTEEMNSAELVVYMGVWKTYLSCSLPVFLVLFLGSWSDRHARRKPFILMPLLGPLIEIFGGVTMIAMRSIVSKLVPTTDIGQLNSLFGVCDALTPILYSTVYNTVYANTQETLIGTIYIMSAVLMTPPAIIFMLIYKMENREKKNIASGQNQALETFKQTSKNEFQPKSYHKNEGFEDDQKE